MLTVKGDGMGNSSSNTSVITGDIVGSSGLSPERRKELYSEFAVLSSLLKKQFPDDIAYDISNFRGDGWQVVCGRPGRSLEIAVFIRTYLRFQFKSEKLDTRAAIGIGRVNFIPPENISAGDGDAFTRSGHRLESLKNRRMGIEYPHAEKDPIFMAVDNLLLLMDHIILNWSPGQCQAVFWGLHRYKQVEIASHWKPAAITQASVSASLKSAGWEQVQETLRVFDWIVTNEVDRV